MLSPQSAASHLDYWIGVDECSCNSPLPTGGCRQCFLKSLRVFVKSIPDMIENGHATGFREGVLAEKKQLTEGKK